MARRGQSPPPYSTCRLDIPSAGSLLHPANWTQPCPVQNPRRRRDPGVAGHVFPAAPRPPPLAPGPLAPREAGRPAGGWPLGAVCSSGRPSVFRPSRPSSWVAWGFRAVLSLLRPLGSPECLEFFLKPHFRDFVCFHTVTHAAASGSVRLKERCGRIVCLPPSQRSRGRSCCLSHARGSRFVFQGWWCCYKRKACLPP